MFGGDVSTNVPPEAADLNTGLPLDKYGKYFV